MSWYRYPNLFHLLIFFSSFSFEITNSADQLEESLLTQGADGPLWSAVEANLGVVTHTLQHLHQLT